MKRWDDDALLRSRRSQLCRPARTHALHDHVDERRAELGRGSSSDRLHLGAAANARVNVAESIEVLTGFSLKTRS